MDSQLSSPLLHPLLAGRWSPARFDASAVVADDEVDSLLEAARWAPSAGNSQPWAFIVGMRGDRSHARLARHLAGSSAAWAPAASLLLANLAHRYVEGTDWEYSEFSLYDLGQAVAHMSLQAEALGLSARQFRAFDRDGVTAEFAVPPHWQVTTMTAIGRAAGKARPEEEGPAPSSAGPAPSSAGPAPSSAGGPPRRRRAVSDIVWPTA
jgi:nitroreductase